MSGHEAAVAHLRSEGYRMTPQRLSVLDIVAAGPAISALMRSGTWPRSSTPTSIWPPSTRTLQLLKRLGVVTEVVIGNKLHFELADHHNRHNHMVCSECDSVQTLSPAYLAEFSQRLQQEFGFTPDLDNITIGGLCSICQPQG